ncbi:MAG: rarD protein [Gammaproteobacteria bacterium]|nr:rarD protein [Gammaproteobacteria bacterium]
MPAPVVFAVFANAILGASSIYWALFQGVSPVALVGWRVVFSLVLLLFVLVWLGKFSAFIRRIGARDIGLHAFAAVLVAVNWGAFIWASLTGAVLESGFGYLVAPVFAMALGGVLFGEKLSRAQLFALLVIAAVIALLIGASGRLEHWIYFTIAATWGGYTLLKKRAALSSLEGLFVETAVLSVVLLVGLALPFAGGHAPGVSHLSAHPLLALSGVVSVVPLVMFAIAARRLSAYTMGLLQFVLPTAQLVVSFWYFGQIATPLTYACFFVIWAVLFAVSMRGRAAN